MQKLTADQFMGIQNLTLNPSISTASVDFNSKNLRVTVISKPGASFTEIDRVLTEIFPGMECQGWAGHYKGDEFYSFDLNEETVINLCMKKLSAPTESISEENVHPQFSIDLGKVESLLEPAYIKDY